MPKPKPPKCERCRKPTVHKVDHFELTGEYTQANKSHSICMRCWDVEQFNREVRKQQREMTASEDELISGDYED